MSDYEERNALSPPPKVEFTGLAGDFFLLQLGNVGLSIITLGIWRFWGKTRYRRFLWKHTILDGDPLEYRGTGLELFIGALLVILLVSIPFGLLSFGLMAVFSNPAVAIGVSQVTIILLLYYLIGVGQYRSWRYLFSRTSWRGIRSGMTEQGFSFGWYNFGLTLAQLFSLGLATPWVSVKRWNRLVGDVRIGNLAMTSDAQSQPLWGKFLLVWGLVTVPMIAFYAWFFYTYGGMFMNAEEQPSPESIEQLLVAILVLYAGIIILGLLGALLFAQYWAAYLKETVNNTKIGPTMRLRIDVETWDVVRFYLGNIALVMFYVGILLMPFRNWSFMARRMWIDGEYDARDLMQSSLAAPSQGDGLADAFDVSGF
jgi:uncharacterized membrane protein YjgN (DUF898 family)